MRVSVALSLVGALAVKVLAASNSFVLTSGALQTDGSADGIVYRGIAQSNGVDHFLGIRYAQDTGGVNRFKPPRLYTPAPGSLVDATALGTACPQPLGQLNKPLGLANITEVSEDCLNLNIARPASSGSSELLPVMLWIHGGSFWYGVNHEPTTAPDGLILQSVANGLPVMHVAINYRLGFFGFAQSDSLKQEGSENAGMRDQRLAMEWVRDNIVTFGGDPDNITILGQSSGGLAVGLHMLAYGGSKPLPFQQGVAQSQSLEPGITSNFTINAMSALVNKVGCNTTDLHSTETIQCLRNEPFDTLLQASIDTYAADIAHNIGDIWLPVVDGDFLPAAPSQLIAEGRVAKANFMTGWAQGDLNFYTNQSIATSQDTYDFIRAYLPGLTESKLQSLLNLYPSSEFSATEQLSAEFYRSARMFRDVLMVCPSLLLGAAVATTHSIPVFHYDFNQTIVDKVYAATQNISGLGVGHTSEFAFVFNTFSAYDTPEYTVTPTESDLELMKRASRSWSRFASLGSPAWLEAYGSYGPFINTLGGPQEGMNSINDRGLPMSDAVAAQRLEERCAFLNDPEIINALGY
jgi:carboxylesterase type B